MTAGDAPATPPRWTPSPPLGLDKNAPLLCTLAGGRVSDAYVRKLLATLAERAGITPFTTRTLRYTLVDEADRPVETAHED